MPKVYIIGPTVGFPMLNLATFNKVAEVLVKMGLEPVVPHHLFHDEDNAKGGLSFHDALMRRRNALYECDCALLIPGYSEDRFGCIEALSAKQMEIPRYRMDEIKKLQSIITS